MPCAKSQLAARYDKDGKLIGLKLRRCSGDCDDGHTRCTETGRPDPEDDDISVIFCACPEDINSYHPTRNDLVKSCRIAVLRRNNKPFDFDCIGKCDDDATECKPVIIEKLELARGESQHIIECRCIDRVEPLKEIAGAKRKGSSRRNTA